ncbi:MAG: FAD binding domain-containing protein [Pseudonocardia sp.]|nr:FAD binding domain-containing protein [Pseudonocardia sp.]
MRVAAVERPTTVAAVLDRMTELGDRGRLIAGGTALVPDLRADPGPRPLVLISLGAVTDLVAARPEDGFVIGATTTLAELEHDRVLAERFPALVSCLSSLATPRIRHMATVGGALAQRDAGYDLPVVLAALGCLARLRGSVGERSVRVEDLFPGDGDTGETGMRTEVLTSVLVPYRQGERSSFVKLSPRTATDRAVVSAAARVRLNADGRCEEAHLVLGALGPRLVRPKVAERRLRGAARDEIADAVRDVAAGTCPPADVRGSSAYRRSMAPVIAGRALHAAWVAG